MVRIGVRLSLLGRTTLRRHHDARQFVDQSFLRHIFIQIQKMHTLAIELDRSVLSSPLAPRFHLKKESRFHLKKKELVTAK